MRRRAVYRIAIWLCVLDGIVDQVRERLADEFAISSETHWRVGFHPQRYTLLLGQRLIEFTDIVCDFRSVEFAHVFSCLTRLRPRDHQERIERADKAI